MAGIQQETVDFDTAQCRDWKARYFATFAISNNAVLERAKILEEVKEALDDNFSDFLRDPTDGFNLSPKEVKTAADLVLALSRYPDPLLWESLGLAITRIVNIEDARLRNNIVRRIRTAAQYDTGYISSQDLTAIIMRCDPDYYDRHPSDRRKQMLAVEAEKQDLESDTDTLARGMKEALRRLRAEGYSEEDARSFFTRPALDILDNN